MGIAFQIVNKIFASSKNNVISLSLTCDKSAHWQIIFLITQPKHMLWVLKRTVSMRRFFWAPKTHV